MSDSLVSLAKEIEEVEKILEDQRLKRMRKKANSKMPKTDYKYLIAIDFEATCFSQPYNRKFQEIIEFPAVLINLETAKIEKEFQRYIRPVEIPILSEYCVDLTGISQDQVDNGVLLEEAVADFVQWMKATIKEFQLIMPKTRKSNLSGNCILCTWGNWDFLIQLRNECSRKKIRRPPFFNQWMDLKEIYTEKGSFRDKFSFADALEQSRLEFEGRPHSGLDDARMTAKLAAKMFKDGSYLRITKDLNQNHQLNRNF